MFGSFLYNVLVQIYTVATLVTNIPCQKFLWCSGHLSDLCHLKETAFLHLLMKDVNYSLA